jgi:hypothetical protein
MSVLCSLSPTVLPPLPLGEGWGEGELNGIFNPLLKAFMTFKGFGGGPMLACVFLRKKSFLNTLTPTLSQRERGFSETP